MTEEVKTKPVPKAKPAPKAPVEKGPAGIRVQVTGKRHMVQPSTRTVIYPGETTLIEQDGWAENQLAAGLLVKV